MIIKSLKIDWDKFMTLRVEDDYAKREVLVRYNVPHKYKSGNQWICWDKDNSNFLPICEGKLSHGLEI